MLLPLGWGREVEQAESFFWAGPKPQPELVLNHTSPAFCVNPHSKSCFRGWLDLGTTGRNRRWIGREVVQILEILRKPPNNTWLFQQSRANPFSFNKFQLQISQLEFGLLGKTFGNERSLLENFSPTFCSPPGILKIVTHKCKRENVGELDFLASVHPFAPLDYSREVQGVPAGQHAGILRNIGLFPGNVQS